MLGAYEAQGLVTGADQILSPLVKAVPVTLACSGGFLVERVDGVMRVMWIGSRVVNWSGVYVEGVVCVVSETQ